MWCIRNFIFIATVMLLATTLAAQTYCISPTGSGMTLSNNLYYASNSPVWCWNGNSYNTLAAWQAAGLESNATYGDPLFTGVFPVRGTRGGVHGGACVASDLSLRMTAVDRRA